MDFTDVVDAGKRFAGEKKKEEVFDDLLIDRLHNRYTIAILVCFCIALSSYDYLGDPIRCWIPAQLAGTYDDYINRLCYIQNTYHVAKHQLIPQDSSLRRERTIKYYQWIYFVLLLQAFFFFLPRVLWQTFNDKLGLSLRNLVDASNQSQAFLPENERYEIIKYISNSLQRYEEYINLPKQSKSFYHRCRSFFRGRTGASLSYFYIFIKILYINNVICQILFLQYFLSYHDVNYLPYGLTIFEKFFANSFSLPESQLFPRITLCDFQIRELAARHSYTVECVLVINIFIEKMYFLLWIWFAILLLLTIIDTIGLLYRLFLRHSRNIFIKQNLELILHNHHGKEEEFAYFLRYFPIDNILTLRILSANSNSLITAEILDELFHRKLEFDSDV